uniref:hypothetical protein n=1 Tax=Nitrosopumilus sp. TaxID=2024843 RepID=UPI00262CDCE0
MEKWADYLISEVSYDRNHLIKIAIRHEDSEKGISKGNPIDRLAIASDIKNGLTYITVYSSKNSWKKGHKIETFSIDGEPYLRIDANKVKLDFLGDLPESSIIVEEPEPEPKQKATTKPESISEEPPKPEPQSPRGSLPKESSEELPQELELTPEFGTEELTTESELQQSDLGSNETKSRKQQLEDYEKDYLKRIGEEGTAQELDLAPEPVTEETQESTPEPEEESTPEPQSPRGSLPKESSEELAQELDLAPEPVTEE